MRQILPDSEMPVRPFQESDLGAVALLDLGESFFHLGTEQMCLRILILMSAYEEVAAIR